MISRFLILIKKSPIFETWVDFEFVPTTDVDDFWKKGCLMTIAIQRGNSAWALASWAPVPLAREWKILFFLFFICT